MFDENYNRKGVFDADKYWKRKEKPCPYAEGNRCFLVQEPSVESCKGCEWFERWKGEENG